MSPRSTRSIFEDVPFDIWSQIFDYLRWDSWASLQALSLSCQALHRIVLPVLYKTVHIHFPKYEATGHLKLEALLSPELGRRVHHHVQVLIISYGHTFQDEYSSLIYTLVANLVNLEIVRWRLMPFAPSLLSNFANRQHPPTIYYYGDPKDLVTFDNRLATYIKSLSLTFGRDRPAHVDPDVKRVALRSLLPTLPNLTRLALKYHPGVRGRSRPILELPQGSALDSVEDLTLANFSFSADQAASWIRYLEDGTRLRRLALDGTADDLYESIEKLSTSSVSTKLTSLSLRMHDKTIDGILPQLSEALYALLDNIAHNKRVSGIRSPQRYSSFRGSLSWR